LRFVLLGATQRKSHHDFGAAAAVGALDPID
jgi:hypothetical protein